MPNIHVLSDVHLEYENHSMKDHHAPDGTDIVILAGDTHPGVMGVMWAAEHFPNLPVIYVPGNHEYYGKRGFRRHLERMKSKAEETGGNVHVVDRETLIFNNTRFICASLWTDYAIGNLGVEENMRLARAKMNDYKAITMDGPRTCAMNPHALLNEHEKSLDYIKTTLKEPFNGSTVVVTHHAPSIRSLSDEYKNSSVSPCYASDLEWLIKEHQPDIWIHGHLHQCQDYMIDNTRIIANPRGWVSAQSNRNEKERENLDFNSQLLIEILLPSYTTIGA